MLNFVMLLLSIVMASLNLSEIMLGQGDGFTWFMLVWWSVLCLFWTLLILRTRVNGKA